MELIDILERDLDLYALVLALNEDRLRDRLLLPVDIAHKADNSLRLMVRNFLRGLLPLVPKHNREARVQIRGLVKPRLHLRRGELRHLEDLRVRREADGRSCLLCLSECRKKSVHQLFRRDAALKMIVVNIAVTLYDDVHVCGQGVDDRGADAVEAAGRLVGVVVEFSARVQRRVDEPLGRHALLMHADGNASAVVRDLAGPVRLERNIDMRAVAGEMLVDRIVYDFVNEMIESLAGCAANIHPRADPDGLETLEDVDAGLIIYFLFCHRILHEIRFSVRLAGTTRYLNT